MNIVLVNCSDEYPTPDEFREGLGGYATALYVCSGTVTLVLCLQYGFMLYQFFQHVPMERLRQTLWVNSVYAGVALFTTISLVLPKSSLFVWSIYRVFLGIALGRFVDLIMMWHDGESAIMTNVDEHTTINMRSPPCCFCLCCPTEVKFTKRKLRLMKMSVYQMPYIQSVCIFVLTVLGQANYVNYDDYSGTDEYLYLQLIMTISFLCAMWGLFLIMGLTVKYQLLKEHKFVHKAALLKTIVVFINLQGLLFDILSSLDVINCVPPISGRAMGSVYSDICSLIEAFLLGNICFYINVKDATHY